MEKYAIFLDIDGTFLDSKGQLIKENTDAVKEYIEKGHKIFICSGRPEASIHDYIKTAVPWSGIISSAGGQITIGNERIKREEISKKTVRTVAEAIFESGVWGVFGNDKDGICVNIEERLNWKRAHSLEEFDKLFEYATKIDFCNVSDEQKAKIEKASSDELYTYYYDDYSESIKKGNSKAIALKTVLEKLGMDISQSIAVGDSSNDLDIIEAAGIGIAMANAPEEVKARADMVADTNDNAGVAKILKEVLK